MKMEMNMADDANLSWSVRELEFLAILNNAFAKYRAGVMQSESQQTLRALYVEYKNAITEYENALREEQQRRAAARISDMTMADIITRFNSENLLIGLQNLFYQYTFAGNEKTLANDILTYLENRHCELAQSRKAE